MVKGRAVVMGAEDASAERGAEVEEAARQIQRRETDPYTASEQLIARFRARA